jgi:hypothetical protein
MHISNTFMTFYIKLTTLYFIILLLCNCQKPASKTINKPNLEISLSPNTFEIAGTIKEILEIEPNNSEEICAKVACKAKVSLDQIVGYGSGVNVSLSEGQIIEIKFLYTLSNTGNFFPELIPPLDGLDVGDSFKAVVTIYEGTNEKNIYEIGVYEKK